MTPQFKIESGGNCKPYSRSKLYKEILEFRTCGVIHHMWLSAGHLFITLDGGKQLYTFDCKNLDNTQDTEYSGCLDVNEEFPVLQILLKPPNTVFVVFKNGITQYWIYKQDSTWKKQTTHRICSGSLMSVTDVCYNVSQNALYWCQEEVSEKGAKTTYSIYKRQIIEGADEDTQTVLKLGPVSTIIKNCPKCYVYPVGHGIVFVSESSENQVPIVVRISTASGHIDLLVGQDWLKVDVVSVHTPVQYSKIVVKNLQHIAKLKSQFIIQSTYTPHTETLHLLYNSGQLCTISCSSAAMVTTVELDCYVGDGLIGICSQGSTIGLVYQQYIRQYSTQTGRLLCTVDIPHASNVLGVAQSLFGGLQQAVCTEDNFYFIQKSPDNRNTSEMSLLEMSQFQSDAVRLSYIDKMQKFASQSSGDMTLEVLQKKWIDNLGTPPTSKLVETVDPFISQYWKLEKLLQEGLKDPKKICQLKPESIDVEVNHLLDPKSPLTRPARQAQLLVLAQYRPLEVLDSLLRYLAFPEDAGEMSTSQKQKWQCALTQESCNVSGSCDIAVPLFELMCHLLYKHKPDKLIQFVLHGQKVWDQKVGMSAFVRRRQIPYIYERALKCIPQPEHSVDKQVSILAHVNILITSEIAGCYTKAVHLLLEAEMWPEVLDLLKEYRDKCEQFALLYQMTLAALTKKEVLHKYAEQIFALTPSFTGAYDVVGGNSNETGIGVLCEGDEDISIGSVRPYLLQCFTSPTDKDIS